MRTVTIPVVSGTGRSVRTTDVGTMLQIGSSSLVFRSGKTGTLPARTRITTGRFQEVRQPYGEQKEGRDRSFGDRKSGGYSRSDKPYGERRYDDRKQDGYKTFDKPYGERRFDDRKSGGFRGGDRSFGRRDDKFRSYPRYNPNKPTGEIRLNRFIAQSGICSRREADDFIQAGLVTSMGWS